MKLNVAMDTVFKKGWILMLGMDGMHIENGRWAMFGSICVHLVQ
jgi:hypothetical protein